MIKFSLSAVKILEFDLVDLIHKLDCLKLGKIEVFKDLKDEP